VTILHDRSERLDHPNVRAQSFQGVQQGGHQRDHQEDVEQFLGGREARIEYAAKCSHRTVCPSQRHQKGSGDRRHDDVGAQNHRQHDHRNASQIDPMRRAD